MLVCLQFPLLTTSLGRRVLKGWELAYKISQFIGGKSLFILYLRYLPLPLLIHLLLPLFLHAIVSSIVSFQDLPLDFPLRRCPLHLH
jgi:hypothetical protein